MSTSVPAALLPHTITLVRPDTSGTDGYSNTVYDYGPAATRTEIKGWLQQDTRRQLTGVAADGRATQVERWLLVTNHADVRALDRFEWSGLTFETDGPPAPAHTPRGLHHQELALRIVTG
ncbi:hypothetical protein [Streptomyces sp. bgisy153]|uniref:hypothetical protein n=1 Tax=Streptomyces sp. bgisy153 TaxID=3413793 RepID=UPI003D704220